MGKDEQNETNNPFAQLTLSKFPNKSNTDEKLSSEKFNQEKYKKIINPQKKNALSSVKASVLVASADNEDSLFFANMSNVQKLSHAPKEGKKHKSTKTKQNCVVQNQELKKSPLSDEEEFSQAFSGAANTIGFNSTQRIKETELKTTQNLPKELNFVTERKIEKALTIKGDMNVETPFDVPAAFAQSPSSQKSQYDASMAEKMPAYVADFKTNHKQEVADLNQNANNNENSHVDELNLFFSAVSDVKTLHGKGRDIIPEPISTPPALAPIVSPLQGFMDEKLEFAMHANDDYIEAHVLGLDLMTVGKLQARQNHPEAHIDLHGLHSEQAYDNLIAFFRNAYHRGLRTLLVVTGKGNNSINGTPVLRTKAQEWFTQDPFRRVILAFCTAKIEDGGSGALYVLIRKQKKDYGTIQWDIKPTDPDFFL